MLLSILLSCLFYHFHVFIRSLSFCFINLLITFDSYIYNICYVLMHIKDHTPPYIPHTPDIWSLSLSVCMHVSVCLVMHTGESITFTHPWALKGLMYCGEAERSQCEGQMRVYQMSFRHLFCFKQTASNTQALICSQVVLI